MIIFSIKHCEYCFRKNHCHETCCQLWCSGNDVISNYWWTNSFPDTIRYDSVGYIKIQTDVLPFLFFVCLHCICCKIDLRHFLSPLCPWFTTNCFCSCGKVMLVVNLFPCFKTAHVQLCNFKRINIIFLFLDIVLMFNLRKIYKSESSIFPAASLLVSFPFF